MSRKQESIKTRDRMVCMFEHREADRVPITDGPWGSTVARWRREGMPENVHFADYFELDKFTGFGVNNSPRYPVKTIGKTPEFTVRTTEWIVDMWNTQLDMGIALWDMALAEGYRFDAVSWPDDMGFKLNYIISTDHSVPDSVSLEDFRRFVALAKELATY